MRRERKSRPEVGRSIAIFIAGVLILGGHVAGAEVERGVGDAGRSAPLWLSGPGGIAVPRHAQGDSRSREFERAALSLQLGANDSRASGARSKINASAFLTGLMSAVLPGAGQVRNGSYLRGFGYFAAEVTGWVAYSSFRRANDDKGEDLDRFSGQYWEYDRYHTRAPGPDSCQVYQCPCGEWTESRDAEIVGIIESGSRGRFLEYVTRDAYACGWDAPVSRDIYLSLYEDREDARTAQSWSGRLIFINHLISAVDAFLEVRAVRLQLDSATQVRFDVRGLPFRARPEVRITRHFG
ncbi:MAG: hypothetical protein V1774_10980 [Candidatus Eisenbacteria bacterium]